MKTPNIDDVFTIFFIFVCIYFFWKFFMFFLVIGILSYIAAWLFNSYIGGK